MTTPTRFVHDDYNFTAHTHRQRSALQTMLAAVLSNPTENSILILRTHVHILMRLFVYIKSI